MDVDATHSYKVLTLVNETKPSTYFSIGIKNNYTNSDICTYYLRQYQDVLKPLSMTRIKTTKITQDYYTFYEISTVAPGVYTIVAEVNHAAYILTRYGSLPNLNSPGTNISQSVGSVVQAEINVIEGQTIYVAVYNRLTSELSFTMELISGTLAPTQSVPSSPILPSPPSTSSSGIKAGTIIGIVIGCSVVVVCVIALYRIVTRSGKAKVNYENV
eukprot:TRINITY_DN1745_c0_g1_i1.p1 TRINITY_DN1745_c0_g1~~TRINITY_DN1745_c0_g1_i1.p1  ORF type:complete len:215 (-),score=32.56 TRINITY_DN1745_c0_g1_i1:95-739(-)